MVILRGFPLIAYSFGWCYIMVPGGLFCCVFCWQTKSESSMAWKKNGSMALSSSLSLMWGVLGFVVRNTSGLCLVISQESNEWPFSLLNDEERIATRWGWNPHQPVFFQNRFGEDLVMTIIGRVYPTYKSGTANLTQDYQRLFQFFSKLLGGLEVNVGTRDHKAANTR